MKKIYTIEEIQFLERKEFKKLKNYESLVAVDKMNEPVHKKFFIRNNKLKPVFDAMDGMYDYGTLRCVLAEHQ